MVDSWFPVIQLLGSLEAFPGIVPGSGVVLFPVIQLLGSLEAVSTFSGSSASKRYVSSNSASRKLGSRLKISVIAENQHSTMFPVIQLLGSLEAGQVPAASTLTFPGVSSNSASRKLGSPFWLSRLHGGRNWSFQ